MPRLSAVAGPLAAAGLIATSAGLIAACGSSDADSGAGADHLVATIPVWADIASAVTCSSVDSIVPPGTDIHSFEPSLADRSRLEGALVIENGLGLEGGLGATIDEIDGPVFTASDHADLPSENPHIWFDPDVVAQVVPALADAAVDSGYDGADVAICRDGLLDDLRALDADISERIGALPESRRVIVTDHDELADFADRYGVEVVGTVVPSTSSHAEPSAEHLVELEASITERGIGRLIVQPGDADPDATALAERLGLEIVELPVPGEVSYIDQMRGVADAVIGSIDGVG